MMGVDVLLFISLPIQYINVETRHSRLPQASEQCFRKTPNYLKISLLQEERMFGVLRQHRSEACGRRLYLVKKSLVQQGGMFRVLRKHRSEACGRRLCLVINKSCIPLDIV